MDYIYMLRCGDGSYYTGWTNRLGKRLAAHAAGKGAKYTKSHQPVEAVHAESFPDKSSALKRECEIKALTRQEKEALISSGRKGSKLFYLMGKSASGKDSLYAELLQQPQLQLKPLVIYTTRPIRDGEVDGVSYHFTDEDHLAAWLEEGRVIELRTYETVYGPWKYFTLDDGIFDEPGGILGIGTLESYVKLREYLGADRIVPLYIEVEDGLRLMRALKREQTQETPKYAELCRRFLADGEDFSEEKLAEAGIVQRFSNDGKKGQCLEALTDAILLGELS